MSSKLTAQEKKDNKSCVQAATNEYLCVKADVAGKGKNKQISFWNLTAKYSVRRERVRNHVDECFHETRRMSTNVYLVLKKRMRLISFCYGLIS